MEWRAIAESELIFFFTEYRQAVDDLNMELEEQKDDIRAYPVTYADDILHRICFYVPTVEDEVLRREEKRERSEAAIKKAHIRAKRTACALDTLSDSAFDCLMYVYGEDHGLTEYQLARMLDCQTIVGLHTATEKALSAFYEVFRHNRLEEVEERNKKRLLTILKANGLEDSPKGKQLA